MQRDALSWWKILLYFNLKDQGPKHCHAVENIRKVLLLMEWFQKYFRCPSRSTALPSTNLQTDSSKHLITPKNSIGCWVFKVAGLHFLCSSWVCHSDTCFLLWALQRNAASFSFISFIFHLCYRIHFRTEASGMVSTTFLYMLWCISVAKSYTQFEQNEELDLVD